ncbi:hypothetical protein Tco_0324942 [Tanacetum coccineum]
MTSLEICMSRPGVLKNSVLPVALSEGANLVGVHARGYWLPAPGIKSIEDSTWANTGGCRVVSNVIGGILSMEASDMDTKLLLAPESNNTLANCLG